MNIEYSDNQDGTGITVTISDSDPTDEHEIYVQTLNGQYEDWIFNLVGTQTGDGSIVVPVVGSHFRYVKTGSEVSPVSFGLATNNEPAIHYACLLAVQARLRQIGLEGIHNDDIVIRKMPSDRGTRFELNGTPTIVIAPPGVEGQGDGEGTNERDDVEYPIIVTILRADNQNLETDLNQGLLWRQKINWALRQQRLPGVPSICKVKMTPGPVIDETGFWNNRYLSSFIVRPMSREGRGI